MRTVAVATALALGCVGQPRVAASPPLPTESEDGQQAARSPLEGTWKANLEKSRRDPNHLFDSLTLKFAVSGDTVTLVYSGINMSGEEESATTTLQADGRERPVSEQAPGVMLVTRWVSANMLETVTTKDGESVGRGTYEVSADGKTLTATVSGTDAGGRRFENVVVADRE